MKKILVSVLVAVGLLSAAEPTPLDKDGSLVLADARFLTERSFIRFSGTVANRSAEKWRTVQLAITVALRCPEIRSLSFRALVGDIDAGSSASFSDPIMASIGPLDQGCAFDRATNVTLASGLSETAYQRKEEEHRAEIRRKVAEDIEATRARMEQDRKSTEEVRVICRRVYETTFDKRIADLTVKEVDQISTCRALGTYSK